MCGTRQQVHVCLSYLEVEKADYIYEKERAMTSLSHREREHIVSEPALNAA